jgi:Metal binding domain of Ada
MINIFKSLKKLYKDEERVERNWWKIGSIVVISCLIFGSIVGFVGNYLSASLTTASTSSTVDERIKGNKRSRIYHWSGCPNYDDVSPQNIRWFRSREEAEAAGYRAARNC